jgi:hypothetical protein
MWKNNLNSEDGRSTQGFTDVASTLGIDKGFTEGRGLLVFDYDGDGDQDLLNINRVSNDEFTNGSLTVSNSEH